MSRKRSGLELYEVIARQRGKSPGATTGNKAASTPAYTPSGKEIIFSIDSAFIIFIAVLLFIGCSYAIGYQRGKATQTFIAGGDARKIEKESSVLTISEPGGSLLSSTVKFQKGHYTLKLRFSRQRKNADFAELEIEKKLLLSDKICQENGLEVFTFDNNSVYALGIGVFKKDTDEKLIKLRKYFSSLSEAHKYSAYRGCSIELGSSLGRVITED